MELKTNQVDYHPAKLQALANKLSLHFWSKACDIPVVWNGRLTRSMGRFLYSTKGKKRIAKQIELSKQAAQFIDRETFIAVLLHELAHYHLFIQDKPYDDHHPVFEQELARVGAISTNTVQLPQKTFLLSCSQCKKRLGYRKRMNLAYYKSGCCKAEITKQEVWVGEFIKQKNPSK